jgi:P-loop Domain of unknown function (DUF2791)
MMAIAGQSRSGFLRAVLLSPQKEQSRAAERHHRRLGQPDPEVQRRKRHRQRRQRTAVRAAGSVDANDAEGLLKKTNEQLEQRLASISKAAPMFPAALRTYRDASSRGDTASAEGLPAWISGQPNVAAGINEHCSTGPRGTCRVSAGVPARRHRRLERPDLRLDLRRALRVVPLHRPREDVLFERMEPGVENGPQRPLIHVAPRMALKTRCRHF